MGNHTPPRIAFPANIEYEPNTGCWLWARGAADYGFIAVAPQVHMPVHRYSFQTFKGPIPKGLVVRHKCDTPACVNPEHLLLGTHKLNALDRQRRGRGRFGPHAPKHAPYHKVMPARLAAYRAAYEERQRQLYNL